MKQRSIVIADDDSDLAQLLAMRCQSLGLNVYLAYDGSTALNLIRAHHPDVICLDLHMPSGDGLSLFQMIQEDKGLPSVPLILMTGDTNEDTIRECHQMCAYYVEKCTDIWKRLEPLIRDLFEIPEVMAERMSESHYNTNSKSAPAVNDIVEDAVDASQLAFAEWGNTNHSGQPCVLCIDDDQDYSRAIEYRLERFGVAVLHGYQGSEGFLNAFANRVDVVLLDYELPNGQGDYVLRRLKDNPVTADIPVFVITGRNDRALARRMMNLGAAQFFVKPINFELLVKELRNYIDFPNEPSKTYEQKLSSGCHAVT